MTHHCKLKPPISARPFQEVSRLEVAADWLLTDKVSSWPGKPAERGWRYLRQSLKQYDTVVTDFKYSQAAFETLLSHDSSSPPPTWLAQLLEVMLLQSSMNPPAP